jgi:hypothetical protein
MVDLGLWPGWWLCTWIKECLFAMVSPQLASFISLCQFEILAMVLALAVFVFCLKQRKKKKEEREIVAMAQPVTCHHHVAF